MSDFSFSPFLLNWAVSSTTPFGQLACESSNLIFSFFRSAYPFQNSNVVLGFAPVKPPRLSDLTGSVHMLEKLQKSRGLGAISLW